MENKKNEPRSAKENLQPGKEIIKRNSEGKKGGAIKKDLKEKQVEHNYSKDQE